MVEDQIWIQNKGGIMGNLTFLKQIILGIVLIIVGNILAFVFHNGIFSNIMWILYGLLFILNPVYPEQIDSKKGKQGARIAGFICIVVGLLTRFIV